MNTFLGWLVLLLVVAENGFVVAAVRRRLFRVSRWKFVLVVTVVNLTPPVLVGFALAKFGVHLVGGGS